MHTSHESDAIPDTAGVKIITESLVFRYGADMSPDAIAAATPGARFVARARLIAGPVAASPAGGDRGPSGADAPTGTGTGFDGEVWGILLIQPEAAGSDRAADVVTDTGYRTHVAVLTDGDALADRAAVIAQARYWELSPAYIRRLSLVAG